ncbi:MAG: hypothetical protein ACJ8DZ_07230 [Allosphingosinicella sp.]
MTRLNFLAAAGLAALAAPAIGQSSVEIHTGANGQMSGSATAGSASSTVNTGTGAETRGWDERAPLGCGDGNRSMRVVSPDGSSSSSVSVSGGTVAVGGSGSPGSRISEGGCPETVAPTPRVVATPRTADRPATTHRTYAHRTRHHATRRR